VTHTLRRMVRAALLDRDFYEAVEHDPSATRNATGVVILVAVCSGVGAALYNLDRGAGAAGSAFLLRLGGTFAGWLVWALVTLWVGTSLTRGPETRTDLGEVLRVLGYAQAPWVLSLFLFLPGLGAVVFAISSLWVLLAGVTGLRAALDFTTSRAVLTVVLGWVMVSALMILLTVAAAGLHLVS